MKGQGDNHLIIQSLSANQLITQSTNQGRHPLEGYENNELRAVLTRFRPCQGGG